MYIYYMTGKYFGLFHAKNGGQYFAIFGVYIARRAILLIILPATEFSWGGSSQRGQKYTRGETTSDSAASSRRRRNMISCNMQNSLLYHNT